MTKNTCCDVPDILHGSGRISMLVWYSIHGSLKKRTSVYETGVIKCKQEKRWQRKYASLQFAILSHCLSEWECRNVQFTFFKGIVGTLAISKSTSGTHSNILRNSSSQIHRLTFAHLMYHCDMLFDQTEKVKAGKETFRKRFKYFWVSKYPVFMDSHRCIWKPNI